MKAAYIREANSDLVEKLAQHNIDRWFAEKSNETCKGRPVLQEMLESVRSGDMLYIYDFAQIACSTTELLRITDKLIDKDVNFFFIKEKINSGTIREKFMLAVIRHIVDFERQTTLERK